MFKVIKKLNNNFEYQQITKSWFTEDSNLKFLQFRNLWKTYINYIKKGMLCIGYKKSYVILDLETEVATELFPLENKSVPLIRMLSDDILVGNDGIYYLFIYNNLIKIKLIINE